LRHRERTREITLKTTSGQIFFRRVFTECWGIRSRPGTVSWKSRSSFRGAFSPES